MPILSSSRKGKVEKFIFFKVRIYPQTDKQSVFGRVASSVPSSAVVHKVCLQGYPWIHSVTATLKFAYFLIK
jgi:hypothetical protein